MKPSAHDSLLHGIVGGMIAGAIVAIWFLVMDSFQGQPLRTPEVLARVVLGPEASAGGARLVAVYTLLHFAVFAVLGALTAWFLTTMDIAPGVFVGLAFGVGVLDAVYYTVLLITGQNMLTVIPFQRVLAANVLGGLGLVGYLHLATRDDRPFGLGVLRGHPSLTRGLVTGLLGAAVVALWFLLVDGLTGRPFETPAALGSVLLLGAQSPAEVELGFGIVATYTVLHVAAFSVAGVLFVVVAEQIERIPGLWLLFLLAFIVLEAVFVTTVGLLSEWAMGSLAWWAVGVGNLLAVTAMSWWVWRTHPALRKSLFDVPVHTRL